LPGLEREEDGQRVLRKKRGIGMSEVERALERAERYRRRRERIEPL
jgi:hypothetical protein